MFQHAYRFIALSFATMLPGVFANAAQLENRADAIELIGTVEIHDGNIERMYLTECHGRDLLYLEDTREHAITVVDVTDATHPTVARKMTTPQEFGRVEAVAGDAALVTNRSQLTPTQPECLSIVMLGNGDNGRRVKHTFIRVTAVTTDHQRALIYLVDQDGLKILHETPAPDPRVEREFEKRLLYDR